MIRLTEGRRPDLVGEARAPLDSPGEANEGRPLLPEARPSRSALGSLRRGLVEETVNSAKVEDDG